MKEFTRYETHGAFHWDWFENPRHWYPTLVNNSLKYLASENGTVLDIGSGDGRVDRTLIDLGFNVIGIEPDKMGNKIARERVPEMLILENTLEDVEFPFADYLYSLNTIEHTDTPKRYLEAMKKIKNFGIVITDNAEMGRTKGEFHTKEYTLAELKKLFSNFRVEVLELGMKEFIGIKIYA